MRSIRRDFRCTRFVPLLAAGAVACAGEEQAGLFPTPVGDGPKVVFDLRARPLPDIPFPNDLATRPDLDSPTGRRINASLVAPTLLETEVREEFSRLDGFGTLAAMTVRFEEPVDPNAVRRAHADDDFSNDVAYLINLKTGEPVALDMGRGNYPVAIQNNDKYFMNDVRQGGSNLLFETELELDANGNGQLDPDEDTDGDGVWDRPNTADPTRPHKGVNPDDVAAAGERGNDVYRDLLGFYERETNTLIIRPVVPLQPRTTYAVVLTRRLRDTSLRPVKSPFAWVNHASQTAQLKPLVEHMEKGRIAGLSQTDVAFAWAFTTQSTTTDLEEIRNGLHGKGKLAWIGAQVDDRLEPVRFYDPARSDVYVTPMHPMRSRLPATSYRTMLDKKLPAGAVERIFVANAALLPRSGGIVIGQGANRERVVFTDRVKNELFVSATLQHTHEASEPVVLDDDTLALMQNANPYIVPLSYFHDAFEELVDKMDVEQGADTNALLDSYRFVDYFVIGSFKTANFLDDPERPTFDAVFRADPEHGLARVWARPDGWADLEVQALQADELNPLAPESARLRQAAKRMVRDRVWFFLAVPKTQYEKDGKIVFENVAGATVKHGAPFPVAIYGHGYTSSRIEHLGFAGNLAKYGIASVSIDSYGHGLDLGNTDRMLIQDIISKYGFSPLMRALFKGRARDLDNDGVDNSGGDFWVADTFHTRDVVRQSIVDWMQLIRVFHAFGTYELEYPMPDGSIQRAKAGDFNFDGVVDVAGPPVVDGKKNPGSDFFAWGQSLGGILSGILPAVEPAVVAAAPVAGGGGLSDIGIRSEQGGVIQAVFLEILGPIIAGVPAGDGVHLWLDIQDTNRERRIQITETPVDIKPGDIVEVVNLDNDSEEIKFDRVRVQGDGRFRLAIAADNASFLDGGLVDDKPVRVGACEPEDVRKAEAQRLGLRHPADCLELRVYKADGTLKQKIDTFPKTVKFQNRVFEKDSKLVALARGFGMKRGTPTFRRFMTLAQTIMEPGDPGNYSPHYYKNLLGVRQGKPAAVLVVGTTGDLNVPVNTAYAQARAAGVLPYVYDPQKHAAWGMSPNDVLIRSHAMECLEKLRYYKPLADHMRAKATRPNTEIDRHYADLERLVTCETPEVCEQRTLVDVSNYGCDAERGICYDNGNPKFKGYGGAPRLRVPLRDAVTVEYDGFGANDEPIRMKSALVTPYVETTGHHGFDTPHPKDPFDVDVYMINMVGRFFQTRGADLRYDLCMHRDGFDRPRLVTEGPDVGKPNPDAKRVPGCEFIPTPPDRY